MCVRACLRACARASRVMELLHDKERNKSALDAFLADLQQQMQHLQVSSTHSNSHSHSLSRTYLSLRQMPNGLGRALKAGDARASSGGGNGS